MKWSKLLAPRLVVWAHIRHGSLGASTGQGQGVHAGGAAAAGKLRGQGRSAGIFLVRLPALLQPAAHAARLAQDHAQGRRIQACTDDIPRIVGAARAAVLRSRSHRHLDKVHQDFFDAIHKENRKLEDKQQFLEWAARERSGPQEASSTFCDELGYLALDQQSSNLFYQVISTRHSQKRSTIITTNTAFSDWGNILFNTTIATAIADRLVENSEIFMFGGDSLRKPKNPNPPAE